MSLNVRRLCSPCEIQVMVRIQLLGTLHEFVSRIKILKNYHLLFHTFFVSFLTLFFFAFVKKRNDLNLGVVQVALLCLVCFHPTVLIVLEYGFF
jgi:hypothetical protein